MPTVIDLFSGVGGLSLGAARANFNLIAAVENDPLCVRLHQENFPAALHLHCDIATIGGDNLLAAAKVKRGSLTGLIGGPPCQGFSVIGGRKKDDDRNQLFTHFFRLVKETLPGFFLAENVPGILQQQYQNLLTSAFALIPANYVLLPPIKIKAFEYGAPTTRTRIFFIGYNPDLVSEMSEKDFAPPKLNFSVQVKLALRGLNQTISPEWQEEEQSWQSVKNIKEVNYFTERVNGKIPEGVGSERAIERYAAKREVSGFFGTRHGLETLERFAQVKPGKADPVSRAIRLRADGLCPTLRAGTGFDRGRRMAIRPIHHRMDRVITPREAARLQGFPDWFVFHPTKWHSFRQIGNSVSPIVAEFLLNRIYQKLRSA